MAKSNSNIVDAIYRVDSNPEYRGNPLIEALPDALPSREVGRIFTQRPFWEESETQLPEHLRRHAIARLLYDFCEPFNHHFALEESISRLIRLGYVGRNPALGDLKKHILNGYERVQRGDPKAVLFDDPRSTAFATCLIGCSGIGKTWALNRILATYPPVVFHPAHQLYQVVRLKLDCPKDGSLKALCMEYFIALDKVLDTDYLRTRCRNRASVDELLMLMSQTANEHCLGILVIDEVQHLDRAKSGGAETMLNFFVTLVNTIGVPVVLVGTHKATDILQKDFRQARRVCGMGDHVWDRLEKDSDDWNDLVKALWPFQWTTRRTDLNEDLKSHLFELTQGVVDITVKLFALAQSRAIAYGEEKPLSRRLFNQVMEDSFEMVKPMLQALRFNHADLIERYGDLCAPSILGQLMAVQKVTRKNESKRESTVATPVAAVLVEELAKMLGIGKDLVELAVDKLLTADPGLEGSKMLLIQKVLEVLADDSAAASSSRSGAGTKRRESFQAGDLRLLHRRAEEQGDDVYELLQAANYIKGVEEFSSGDLVA